MREGEWIHLTQRQIDADQALIAGIARFRAPSSRAREAAQRWLKDEALRHAANIATYVLLLEGEVAAFYSLGMSEVELRTQHRKQLMASHPRQGAVVIAWLVRAAEANVDAETILRHAVGIGQIGARSVGAAVIALDPFDQGTEQVLARAVWLSQLADSQA